MADHDLVIRGGFIVDGSGDPGFLGDLAITDGKITQVGKVDGTGKEEIDAAGMVVTPGWVDVHTHYDAQVTWDPYLTPSSWHGVTTAVFGNCGVGFAPAKPDKHEWLIQLMEGVEDIPGITMTKGMVWEWETFPEYLDALDRKPLAIDVGAQVPHGAVRGYVMGERGVANEMATPEDIAQMRAIVTEGLKAGALGISTSRTLLHRDKGGRLMPGTTADEAELFGLGEPLAEVPYAVFQMTSTHQGMDEEFDWMRRLSLKTNRPVTFNLVQVDQRPELWIEMLEKVDSALKEGALVSPNVAGRPAGVLMGWETTVHPFSFFPSFLPYMNRSKEERQAAIRKPGFKEKLMAEESMMEWVPEGYREFVSFVSTTFDKMYKLGDPPNYEPSPEDSIGQQAKREGVSPLSLIFDAMMELDGEGLLYFPLYNYTAGNMDPLHTMLSHPFARISLGDGGAHCGSICDASIPTFMLTHWARDRKRGEKLSLEWAVKRQTSDTATLYGLFDRGLLKPGFKGDVNIIDHKNLRLHPPVMVYDLPANGRRLIQKADGYKATIVSGKVIMRDGETTGELPGKLIRGSQAAPV